MPPFRATKTYEKKAKNPVKRITKSEDAINALFAQNLSKRLISRKKKKPRIEIKELPSRTGAYNLTDDSLKVSADDTFDKVLKGQVFNKVKVIKNFVPLNTSESDSSKSKLAQVNVSFHSPIMTRKRRKRKSVIISEVDPNSSNRALVDDKNTTLDKPVTESLCIEKINNKSVNVSSLSYINLPTITENKILPQEHLNISKMESSYEPMFSETFREKHAVISSTPCVVVLPKITTTDSISPISKSSSNSSKLIEKSYDVIHKWDSTFPASIEGDTPKGPVLRSANRYVGAPAKRVRKRKLTVTKNNVTQGDWKLANSPKVHIQFSEIIDFKTADPKLRVDPKVFLTNCFQDSIQTDDSKDHNLSQDFKGFDEKETLEAEKQHDYICNELRIRDGDEITENKIDSGTTEHQTVNLDTTESSSIVTNNENVVKQLRFVTLKRRGRSKKKIVNDDDDIHLDQELSAVASEIEAILDKSDENFSPDISEFFDAKQTNNVNKQGRLSKKRRKSNKKIISIVDPSATSEIESNLYSNTTNMSSELKQNTFDNSAEDLTNNVLDRLNSNDKQKRVQKGYISKRRSKSKARFTKHLPLGRRKRALRKTLTVKFSDFDSFEKSYLSRGKAYKEIKSEPIGNKVDTSVISISSGMNESFNNNATTSKVIVEKVNQSPKNYPRIYSTDDVKNGVEVVLPKIQRRTSFNTSPKSSPKLKPFHTTVNFSPKQPSLKFSPVKVNVSPGNVCKFSPKTVNLIDSSITSVHQVSNASRCLDFSSSPQRKAVKIIRKKKPKIVVLSDIQLGRPINPPTPLDRVKACKDVWHDHSYSNSPMVNLKKYAHSTPKSSEKKMGIQSFNSNLSKVKVLDAKYLNEDVGSSMQNTSIITTQSKSSSSNLSKTRPSMIENATNLIQRSSSGTEQNTNSKSVEKCTLGNRKVIQNQKSSFDSNSSSLKPSVQPRKNTKILLQCSPLLIKPKTGSNSNLDKSTKTQLMKQRDVYDSDFSDVIESSHTGASKYVKNLVQSTPQVLKNNSKTNVFVQNYSPPEVIRKSIQNAVTQTEQSGASFSSSNITSSVVESSLHLKDSTKSVKRKTVVLRPGKSYRRSLSVLRKSSVFDEIMSVKCPENCVCPTCALKIKFKTNARRSSRMVSFIPQQISVRPSLLQDYIQNTLSYVQEELNNSNLDDSFRSLSINSNNSGFRQSRAQPQVTAKDVVLRKCGQTEILGFQECYPNSLLQNCQKIGEGLYGEVFLRRNPKGGTCVMKIIPIEGDLIVNGEKQKKIEEIVSEIEIATGLSDLRFNKKNCTSNFSEVQSVRCVQGRYPERLLELWELYDESKGSENDSPEMFQDDQQFIVLELANGGKDLESYIFNNAQQVYAIFKQTACALAVAESQLKFEHRDLHWGNILINTVEKEKTIHFRLNGKEITVETYGTEAAIIDFTLSRVEIDGIVFFNDLSLDPSLFVGKGDYQFEIYKLMQQNNGNDWQRFEPYSNILWLHYILDKAVTSALRYKNIRSKVHNEYMTSLKKIKAAILSYNSVVDFVNDNFV